MTTLQKITLRLSEVRSRLNEISGLEGAALTGEITAESDTLQTEYKELETRNRAAIVASPPEATQTVATEDAETRELQRLTSKANVGAIFAAALEHRNTEGESAELQKHFNLSSHQVPLEMLRINRSVEERAAATVPASIGDASQAEVVTPVFASGDGAFLGIERPVVPTGDAAYPVLSTVPSVKGPFSGSDNAAQTDAEFVANNLSPERLQASFSYSRTDAARFAGLDAALRLALNGGLAGAVRPAGNQRQRWAAERNEFATTTM